VLRALRDREDAPAARLLRASIDREELGDAVRAEAIRSLGCCGTPPYRVFTQTGPEIAVAAPEAVAVRLTGRLGRTTPTLADADVALLRRVYEKSRSRVIRSAVVETMSRSGGAATDAWLSGLVRDPNEDIRVRSTALSRLGRSEVPIEELGRLYDALTERELRSTLVQILGKRDEPAATERLMQIVRTGTDPVVRRSAISLLVRKKDPKVDKFLAEVVEK